MIGFIAIVAHRAEGASFLRGRFFNLPRENAVCNRSYGFTHFAVERFDLLGTLFDDFVARTGRFISVSRVLDLFCVQIKSASFDLGLSAVGLIAAIALVLGLAPDIMTLDDSPSEGWRQVLDIGEVSGEIILEILMFVLILTAWRKVRRSRRGQ